MIFHGRIILETTDYEFRAPIRGRATWQGPAIPRSAEIRLFWRTQGKGDSDSETVEQIEFEQLQTSDERTFSLITPIFPSSFSGRLISLTWALELLIDGKGVAVTNLILSPRSGEISLEHPEWITMDSPEKSPTWLQRR